MKQIMTTNFILCADDYGYNKECSAGILALMAHRRLSAVSCMVARNDWPLYAQQLKQRSTGDVSFGLHFQLTDGFSLTDGKPFHGLKQLIFQSLTGQLQKDWILKELRAQAEAFRHRLGIWPQYIDGHQHVHCLPVIRDALLDYIKDHPHLKSAPIRLPSDKDFFQRLGSISIRSGLKKHLIHLLGSKRLRHDLKANNHPCNDYFGGIYPFNGADEETFRHHLTTALSDKPSKLLIMCHPALYADDQLKDPVIRHTDPIAKTRTWEFAYLGSDLFLEDLENHDATLTSIEFLY
jgi:predicted glycoside hydrolase/deacetylase ChbG (UPF0249 family)